MTRSEVVLNSAGGEVEICTDREVVWVNGSDGGCIGRFSRSGIDVHKTAVDQIRDGNECIDCSRDSDWKRFTDGMLLHHGVKLDKSWCPFWAWQFELGEAFLEGRTKIVVSCVLEPGHVSIEVLTSANTMFFDAGDFDRFRRAAFMKRWEFVSPGIGIGETHATQRNETP